jgi:hypothetical protein
MYCNTFQLIPGTSMGLTVKEQLLSTATEQRCKQVVATNDANRYCYLRPSRSPRHLPSEPQRTKEDNIVGAQKKVKPKFNTPRVR